MLGPPLHTTAPDSSTKNKHLYQSQYDAKYYHLPTALSTYTLGDAATSIHNPSFYGLYKSVFQRHSTTIRIQLPNYPLPYQPIHLTMQLQHPSFCVLCKWATTIRIQLLLDMLCKLVFQRYLIRCNGRLSSLYFPQIVFSIKRCIEMVSF